MHKTYCCRSVVSAATLIALVTGTAFAQNYPVKPIRVVTTPIGSGGDITSRLVAQVIAGSLGQSVIVENRPAGVIPGQVVAQAAPDGYTLLHSGSSLWMGVFLRKSSPYDPVRDFQAIVHAVRQPAVLVVHPSLPVKSVKDLIALARSRPGELNYATATLGSLNHLSAELFNSMAGVKVERIDYRGGAEAITDLIAGRVQLMFGSAALVAPHVKSGRLRALAVTFAQPTELIPGLPTVAATGLPGYKSESNTGFFAPAKTPRAIVDRLNEEIARALSRPEVKEKMFATGAEPVGGSPEQFDAVIKDEMATMGKLIKALGIRED